MHNYYQILGVSETASQEDIKRAYKRKAKQYHPDLHKNDSFYEEKFKLINEAYSILSDPNKKWIYDNQLLLLRHSAIHQTESRNPMTDSKSRRPNRRRPPVPRPGFGPKKYEYDMRYEKKGSLYAFIFVGIIGIIFLIGNSIYQYRKDLLIERDKQAFISNIERADSVHRLGEYQNALKLLKANKDQFESINRIKSFETYYVKNANYRLDSLYHAGQYQKSLFQLFIVYSYQSQQNADFYYKMAQCYKELGHYGQAIILLDELLVKDSFKMNLINEIADIYLRVIKDTGNALSYYEMGLEVIEEKFTSTYGDAYRALVNPDRIPPQFYELYWSISQLYIARKEFDKASKTLEWVVFLNPKNGLAFQYLSLSYKALGKRYEACKYYKKAILESNQFYSAEMKNYCP